MFITFEGIEGSSKTTQAGLLSKWLNENNIEHLLTKEPGSVISKECQEIRHLLLSPENNLCSRAELLLYLADRAQHIRRVISPNIKSGKWVVSDRFSFSTYAYQGWGRGFCDLLGDSFLDMLNFAAYDIVPDLIFVMDLPVEVGLQRAKSSNQEFVGGDRMEREELSFHKKLRSGFLHLANKNSDKCVVLNAEKSIEEIHKEVKQVLLQRLNEYKNRFSET